MPDDTTPEDVARELLLKKKPAELVDIIFDLDGKLKALLSDTDAEGTDSSNSHRPSSTDGVAARAKAAKLRKEKSRKKIGKKSRGAQKGHKGKNRKFVPVTEVDFLKEIRAPKNCSDCGTRTRPSAKAPTRHQVSELPPIRPVVTEYRLGAAYCPCCSKTVRASLPIDVPKSAFGVRATAILGFLSGSLRLADRLVQEAMDQLFGLKMSVGSIANQRRRLVAALEQPALEALEFVRVQPIVCIDETGWRGPAPNQWLWTATTPSATAFLIQGGRGKWKSQILLGDAFEGVGVTDRLYSYDWLKRHQSCWAHLVRDFERIAGRPGPAGHFGRDMVKVAKDVMRLQRQHQSKAICRSTYRRKAGGLRLTLKPLLEAASKCAGKTGGSAKAVLRVWRTLWTFATDPEIPTTNNAAERAVRPGVLWRKTRGGTDSAYGSRYVERILTVSTTLRQRGKRILDYLAEAVLSSTMGVPAPSLLSG
jgi:transposase